MEKAETIAKVLGMLFDSKTDSISLTKTSTGKFSYETKIYTDNLLDDAQRDAVLERLKLIHAKLAETYKNDGDK